MDRFEAMRVFTRVLERRSFTLAAQDLDLPRSTVTDVVKQLETRLGTRLLQRTTRVVSSTLDGEAYYRRCISLLADLEDAEAAFAGAKPRGMLRVEVQGTMARHFLFPSLPAFFAAYPDVELYISEADRLIDVVREGVDCVLRYGPLPDSELVARRLGMLDRVTFATPDYIARFGMPEHPDRMEGHRAIALRSPTTGNLRPMNFTIDGVVQNVALPAVMSVTGPESHIMGVKLGLGLGQLPSFLVEDELASGTFVEVLEDYAPPPGQVSLLYPPNKQLSPRVRVFIDWMAREFTARNRKARNPVAGLSE
jgi:DNA-binding transcriptional LysR family regulator